MVLFKRRKVVFLILAISLLIVAIGWKLAWKPILRDASAALECQLSGNAPCLRMKMSAAERAAVSDAQLKGVWERILKPELEEVKRVSGESVEITGTVDSSASASRTYELPNGKRVTLYAQVFQSERGGQFPVLSSMLTSAWRLRYARLHPEPASSADLFRSTYEGLRQDRGYLESIGLTGTVSDPLAGVTPFDQILRQVQPKG